MNLAERASRFVESKLSRRSFLVRSTFAATALAVNPKRYVLEPGTAYDSFCGYSGCGSPNCSCGSRCCEGFSTFCCSINHGYNFCPDGTVLGGWWAAQGSSYCPSGTRYYLDCNATCHCTAGCGGGHGFCDRGSCDGTDCHCAYGNCGNWVTGCYQFRYGQCNTEVGCLGTIVCRIVSCTPPWQLGLGCDSRPWMQDNSTAEMTAPCNTAVPEPPPAPKPKPPPCDSPKTRCESVALESYPHEGGYWLVTSFGKVLAFAKAPFHGDLSARRLAHPVVSMRATPTGKGYWLVTEDGRVFGFGDAAFHGSAVHRSLPKIVGLSPLPDGSGYLLCSRAGNVLAYGKAKFHGSLAGRHPAPITGIETTPTGLGYWLVASDGAVFAFGDATHYGDPVAQHPHYPVVGLRRTEKGYYVVGERGAVWAYGDAHKYGSAYGTLGQWGAVALAPNFSDRGYWVALANGAIYSFGHAAYHGGGN